MEASGVQACDESWQSLSNGSELEELLYFIFDTLIRMEVYIMRSCYRVFSKMMGKFRCTYARDERTLNVHCIPSVQALGLTEYNHKISAEIV